MEQQQSKDNNESTKAILFKGAVKFSVANEKVKAYRGAIHGIPNGVYYKPGDVLDYMQNIFPQLTEAQNYWIDEVWNADPTNERFDRENFTWQVGFYWMENKERGKKELDFFVVPVLVSNADPKHVIDYYDVQKYPFMDRREKKEGDKNDVTDFSYNTGNMFP